MIGVTDSSKIGDELDYKGGELIVVSELSLVGIPEGTTIADSSKL